MALAYDKSLRDLAQTLSADYRPDVLRVAFLPEALCAEEIAEGEMPSGLTTEALALTLSALSAARKAEGADIARDLTARLSVVRNHAPNKREPAPGACG